MQSSIPSEIESICITSPRRDRSISENLTSWIQESLILANSLNLTEIRDRIRSLILRRQASPYVLAVIGDRQRGKSRQINQLIGRELLPTSMSNHAVIYSISGSHQEKAEFSTDGKVWRSLAIGLHNPIELPEIESGKLTQVRLSINCEWLLMHNLAIVEYPSLEKLSAKQRELVRASVATSDLAILAVSAAYPLGMSEANLLQNWVLNQHISQAIVLANRIQTIPDEERNHVYKYLQARVAEVSDQAFLFISGLHIKGLDRETERIQQAIAHFASEPSRTFQRSRHLAAMLGDCLEAILNIGRIMEAANEVSQKKYAKSQRLIEQQLKDTVIKWDKLAIELSSQRTNFQQQVREKLEKSKNDLITRLCFELNKAPDPKIWWENDLEFRLQQSEIPLFQRKVEEATLPALRASSLWLQKSIKEAFGINLEIVFPSSLSSIDPDLNFSDLKLADLQKYRIFSRIGTAATVLAAYILVPPVGAAAMAASVIGSTTAILIGERMVSATAKEQHQLIEHELRNVLDQSFNSAINQIVNAIEEDYKQIDRVLQTAQSQWRQEKFQAIPPPLPNQSLINCRSIMQRTTLLRQDILTALQSN